MPLKFQGSKQMAPLELRALSWTSTMRTSKLSMRVQYIRPRTSYPSATACSTCMRTRTALSIVATLVPYPGSQCQTLHVPKD